ncbi:hypothetical protein IWX92DRAFT_377647, partial [Phyllosticta citricarpa]
MWQHHKDRERLLLLGLLHAASALARDRAGTHHSIRVKGKSLGSHPSKPHWNSRTFWHFFTFACTPTSVKVL